MLSLPFSLHSQRYFNLRHGMQKFEEQVPLIKCSFPTNKFHAHRSGDSQTCSILSIARVLAFSFTFTRARRAPSYILNTIRVLRFHVDTCSLSSDAQAQGSFVFSRFARDSRCFVVPLGFVNHREPDRDQSLERLSKAKESLKWPDMNGDRPRSSNRKRLGVFGV